jgi:hypothetical protein
MPESRQKQNQIFISYRRDDNTAVIGRMYDRLIQNFGENSVFKDIDSIPLGVDFRQHIDDIVQECDVVLAVIGSRWAGNNESTGNRRIDMPDDFVRLEIESALKREIRVIPLLIDNASMPTADSLPESIRGLAKRHGITISHDPHFHTDMERLMKGLEVYFESCKSEVLADASFSTDHVSAAQDPFPTISPPPPARTEAIVGGRRHQNLLAVLSKPAIGYVLASILGLGFLSYVYLHKSNATNPTSSLLVTHDDLRIALGNAKRTIRASGFLVQSIDPDLINNKVKASPEFNAELVIVDPLNTSTVCARERDEDNYLTYEKLLLKLRIFHKNSADLLGNKLKLFVADAYPTMSVLIIDDDLFAYIYPFRQVGTESPVLKFPNYASDQRATFFVEHLNKLRGSARQLAASDFQRYETAPRDLVCPPTPR